MEQFQIIEQKLNLHKDDEGHDIELDVMQLVQNLYDYPSHGFSIDQASIVFETLASEISFLPMLLEDEITIEIECRLSRMHERLLQSYSLLTTMNQMHQTANGESQMLLSDAILYYKRDTSKDDKPIQVILQYILQKCSELRLKHINHVVFRQIFTQKNGVTYATRAWEPCHDYNGHDISTVQLLLSHFLCSRYNNSIFMQSMLVDHKSMAEKLATCREVQFDQLITSREYMSFHDGIYSMVYDAFIPYECYHQAGLPPNLAVSIYHPIDFAPAFIRTNNRNGLPNDLKLHFMHEVSTPHFDKIMQTQKLDRHTQYWLLVMLGRCLFNGSVFESWQVCLYLKGAAGTGKGIIIAIIESLLASAYIVNIANDCQAGFGLERLTERTQAWFCAEVKEDFAVNQAQFESLVSQENITLTRKHQIDYTCKVRGHGILAANVFPKTFHDAQGSLARRIVLFGYNHVPLNADGDLLNKILTEELPFLVRKIVGCYRYQAILLNGKHPRTSGVFTYHLQEQLKLMVENMNPLQGFLCKAALVKRPELWMPVVQFQTLFKTYCQTSGCTYPRWSNSLYEAVFKQNNMKVVRARFTYESESRTEGNIILGCDVKVLTADEIEERATVVIDGVQEQNPYVLDTFEERIDPMEF